MKILNQHVYVFFRWKGWVADQRKRPMRALFMRDFARQELISQGVV